MSEQITESPASVSWKRERLSFIHEIARLKARIRQQTGKLLSYRARLAWEKQRNAKRKALDILVAEARATSAIRPRSAPPSVNAILAGTEHLQDVPRLTHRVSKYTTTLKSR